MGGWVGAGGMGLRLSPVQLILATVWAKLGKNQLTLRGKGGAKND